MGVCKISKDTIIDLTTKKVLSPWVTLSSRSILMPDGKLEIFHSIEQADYVSVLAVSSDGEIPLVSQYRPAVQRKTIELPGGLNDVSELPEEAAVRELYEETGFRANSKPLLLGTLMPDSGRLENLLWCYFVTATQDPSWIPEVNLDRIIYTRDELHSNILNGTFDHALHVALIGLALMRGCFKWAE